MWGILMDQSVPTLLVNERDPREDLLRDISSSFIWLNIYNNSFILESLASSVFDSAGLPPKSINELSIVHFLIYCIEIGICDKIEELLCGFAFNIQRVQEENRSVVRGSINWGVTIQQRIANGYSDRTLFITMNNTRDNDTLQNQLLRFLLTKIVSFSLTIVDINNGSQSYEDAWINQVIKQAKQANRIISHPKFRSVTPLHQISYRHIEATLNSRIVQYRSAAKCAKLYYDIFVKKSVESVRDLILNRVLAPVETPVVYELAVLFKTLTYFENRMQNGDIKRYVVLRSSEQTVFEYLLNGTLYRIYYQTVQSDLSRKQYSNSLKAHGYVGSSLRPDIVVTCESMSNNRQRIIEVKYSLRPSYTYAGLKDVLAYLYEFPDVDSADDGCVLLAMYLDTPEERTASSKVWIAGYNQLDRNIAAFIEKMG